MPSPVLDRKSNSAPSSVQRSERRPALHGLTGVRFFAAFYVVLFHALPFLKSHFRLNAGVEQFLSNGNLAVALLGRAFCENLSGLLSSRSVVVLGGAGYAIYLVQYPVRAWTKLLFSAGPFLALVGSVLTPVLLIALSIAVFRWSEEPLRKLLHPARASARSKS